MPRFGLKEFSTPDYRSSLPEKDPNNAIWSRISAFAKMLHDMSWEDTPEEGIDNTEAQHLVESEAMDYDFSAADAAKKMGGYKPDETKSREPPDMDKEKEISEKRENEMSDYLRGFDPNTATDEEIRQMQRLVAPSNVDADDFADGLWGEDSLKAYLDYVNAGGY